ncbi:MAG: hypothetical protein DWI04_06945 [Planctomycetota bacterium]|nr:MAG: hypothetical protein DWI04_06945 [Planctomycetota bacterium]
MAIFARLVCMLFGIGVSTGLGFAFGATLLDRELHVVCAVIGAVIGIFIGRAIGNMVAGPPPKP